MDENKQPEVTPIEEPEDLDEASFNELKLACASLNCEYGTDTKEKRKQCILDSEEADAELKKCIQTFIDMFNLKLQEEPIVEMEGDMVPVEEEGDMVPVEEEGDMSGNGEPSALGAAKTETDTLNGEGDSNPENGNQMDGGFQMEAKLTSDDKSEMDYSNSKVTGSAMLRSLTFVLVL